MRNLILSLFLFLSLLGFSQTKSERKFIEKINNILTTSKVIKIESLGENRNGSFENLTIYTQKNIPILIIREKNDVTNYEYTDFTTGTSMTYIMGMFYILNWKENKYIRIGKINSDIKTYGKIKDIENHSTEIMKQDFNFDYNKEKIQELINQNNK